MIRLSPEAEKLVVEEQEDKPQFSRDQIISGMIAYAHWKLRRVLNE